MLLKWHRFTVRPCCINQSPSLVSYIDAVVLPSLVLDVIFCRLFLKMKVCWTKMSLRVSLWLIKPCNVKPFIGFNHALQFVIAQFNNVVLHLLELLPELSVLSRGSGRSQVCRSGGPE